MSSKLVKIHERNKEFLKSINIDNFEKRYGYGDVRIIDRDGEDCLIEYQDVKIVDRGNIDSKITKYRYIRVKDSSIGKFIFLSVPNNIHSCKKAVAWTFNLDSDEYNLLFET